jgi:RNA polymerase sigma-70 factor (ECF subfamily)
VCSEEYGRAVAVLVRAFGDIDIAEEAVQDAFVAAIRHWPSAGDAVDQVAGRCGHRL